MSSHTYTTNTVPSAVIHLRNLPQNVTEQELKNLFPNHSIIRTLILQSSSQCFLQFENIEQATECVNNKQPMYIRKKQIYIQFSTRPEIKTKPPQYQNTNTQVNINIIQIFNKYKQYCHLWTHLCIMCWIQI
jgi:RNA recognition motif-containing protein